PVDDPSRLPGAHRTPPPAPQLLALSGKHSACNHFDPPRARAVEHGRPCNLASWRLVTGGGERVVGGGRWVKEVPVSCGCSGRDLILWRFHEGFQVPHRETGCIPRVARALDPVT